ncbi:MAG: hypothetical protein ACTHW1_01500 [Ancrocorticia sp.]|uniref:hypothetical protein n=1 Tax=Ancrocorticia sp. TaxID=2593684 RepID=UPI003F8FFEE0
MSPKHHKKDEHNPTNEQSREYEGPTGLPKAAGGSDKEHEGASGLPKYAGGSESGQPGASGLPDYAGGHQEETSEEDGE